MPHARAAEAVGLASTVNARACRHQRPVRQWRADHRRAAAYTRPARTPRSRRRRYARTRKAATNRCPNQTRTAGPGVADVEPQATSRDASSRRTKPGSGRCSPADDPKAATRVRSEPSPVPDAVPRRTIPIARPGNHAALTGAPGGEAIHHSPLEPERVRRAESAICLTTVSYAAHTGGTSREPRDHGTSHVGIGMSDSLGSVFLSLSLYRPDYSRRECADDAA